MHLFKKAGEQLVKAHGAQLGGLLDGIAAGIQCAAGGVIQLHGVGVSGTQHGHGVRAGNWVGQGGPDVIFGICYGIGGGQLVLPFLDGEAESAALGASYLRLMGCFYFLSFMGHSYVGHYRGIGRMNITFWGTTLQIAVRVVLTYALAGAMGLDAVALATGLGWVAIVLFHSTVFLLELKGIGFRLPTRDEDSQPG